MSKGNNNVKRAERRKRRRAEFRAKDWRANPTAPTPYEGWDDEADAWRKRVRAAVARHAGAVDLGYQKDASRKPSNLAEDEIAVALFAVARVGEKGIAYGQLRLAWKMQKIGFSRAKAGAAFRVLLALGLVVKDGNYANFMGTRRGNCYKLVNENNSAGDEDDMTWLKI